MAFRRLCFSVSKPYANPLSSSPKLPNPLPNSNSHPLLSPESQTLKLGFPSLKSVNPRASASLHTMDGGPRPPPIPHPSSSTRPEIFRALEASLGTQFTSQPILPNPKPLIIVISGPSGVGKDSVIRRLMELRPDLHFAVTATSRAKRPGEVDGKDYFFVGKDEFLKMIDSNELLEYALVYGEYKGVPKQQIRECVSRGCDVVLRVDVQGASKLRRVLRSNAIFVFLVAESEEEMVRRLVDRKTETGEGLLVRVASAREEMRRLKEFDYAVVNKEGEMEAAVKLIDSIIDAEKAKVEQRRAIV